mmetsp:Transcript_84200/g.272515  ORF Transcript_84200/g.272515 Transcript_84200/m.272515 type:complete len:378 (-) Transcript_84200:356-1489(-)
MRRSWDSFASVESSDAPLPEQELELYQADQQWLAGRLQRYHCCCTTCTDSRAYSSSFQSDLLARRARWTGDFIADYGFHVANEHPLLSCFLSHPAHPHSKLERLAVLLMVSCMAFPATLALLRWGKDLYGRQPKEELNAWAEAVLSVEQAFMRVGMQLGIFLFVTIPSAIMQFILESLAILDFQLQEGTGLSRVSGCRPLCECAVRCVLTVKHCCLVFSLLVAGLIYFLSSELLARPGASPAEAAGPFLLSRAQCWVLWFLTDALLPCRGFVAKWCSESSSVDAAASKSSHAGWVSADAPEAARVRSIRQELAATQQSLAGKREEVALLQWRIHHLETELLELEGGFAGGGPMSWGPASDYGPKDVVDQPAAVVGWR